MVILPYKRKRIALPIDAPLVYRVDEENQFVGGTGDELAHQIIDFIKKGLEMDQEDISYIRCK